MKQKYLTSLNSSVRALALEVFWITALEDISVYSDQTFQNERPPVPRASLERRAFNV